MVRDAAWWDVLLLGYAQQALGVSAFCQSRGVRPWQFHYQRRKRESERARGLARPPNGPIFREYLLADSGHALDRPAVTDADSPIRLHVGAVVIELLPGFDVASLCAVLSCCR